jgi:hypothetical protein
MASSLSAPLLDNSTTVVVVDLVDDDDDPASSSTTTTTTTAATSTKAAASTTAEAFKPPGAIWVHEANAKTDLIFGRGGLFMRQPRYHAFRKLVFDHLHQWRDASLDTKTYLAVEIYQAARKSGTRFYQHQHSVGTYALSMDRHQVLLKIRQMYFGMFLHGIVPLVVLSDVLSCFIMNFYRCNLWG